MLENTNSLPTHSPAHSAPPKKHRRIVAVQGAVQLVSALAAMRLSERQDSHAAIENHLIVHDLSAPATQADSFSACLQGLAQQAAPWESMHYLSSKEMLHFQEALKTGSWQAASQSLHETLRFDHCDELLLGQNLLFINNLLSRSYPNAEAACYGDGIGLNFTAEYYTPVQDTPRGLRAVERWFRHRIKALRGEASAHSPPATKSKKHAVAFRRHYLLLANQFDQQLAHFDQLEAADFADLFRLFAGTLPHFAPVACRDLEEALATAEQVLVLLTSNFSETQRMTLEGEVASCMEMVSRCRHKNNAVLVIKPHPRDSREKVAAIVHEAQKSFDLIVTLTDPWTFFVPFESVFDRYFASSPRVQRMTTVICSSSACVSLEMLYAQPCELGFGTKNVRRHFAAKWQSLRLRHEADLNRLVQHIRSFAKKQRAA